MSIGNDPEPATAGTRRNPRPKVLAYVVRPRGGTWDVLVFEHVGCPEAGVQVPGGSIEPGEMPQQAAYREVWEETGLTGLTLVQSLGPFLYYNAYAAAWDLRHVFVLTPTGPVPECWDHVVMGGGEDRSLRFRCFWLDREEAARVLIGGRGEYLRLVSVSPAGAPGGA